LVRVSAVCPSVRFAGKADREDEKHEAGRQGRMEAALVATDAHNPVA
jgi:hypothetical protein